VEKPDGRVIATWDAATGVWMREDALLCGHSAPYSETWPMHGTTRGGRAFARATWEPRTSAGASSSSLVLPTPRATRGGSNTETAYRLGGERADDERPQGTVRIPLLPTPVASDPNGSETVESWEARRQLLEEKGYNANGAGTPLSIAVRRLLPTPEASDGTGGRVSSELGGTRPSGAKRAVTLATQLAFLLPTPRAATARSSRRAMVENQQWSAPSLEQALEIARGELPREFRSWDEVPGRSRLLPTPTASDGTGGVGYTTAEGSPNLRTVVAQLSIGDPTDRPSSAGSD
jgi:hypothetical protein